MQKEDFSKLLKETEDTLDADKSLSELAAPQRAAWTQFLKNGKITFDNYKTCIGSLVFESKINFASVGDPDELMEAISDVFIKTKDKRSEVGQVLAHVRNQRALYNPFLKNVESIVLILDKKDLKIEATEDPDSVEIGSAKCAECVGFISSEDGAVLNLCDNFFYSGQMIPATIIFGSGFFIAPDKIATAGHVVHEIGASHIDPEDVIFIRGYSVRKKMATIIVKKEQLYQLDQEKVKQNSQIILGETGDAAWLKVKPLFGESRRNDRFGFSNALTAKIPKPKSMEASQPVYALGHGFGVPMKLSFGGTVEYAGNNGWMGCDLDIFPGNSGSPVFHANTHELLGIISGPDNLWQSLLNDKRCITVKINNDNGQSVQTTRIEPLIQKIQIP